MIYSALSQFYLTPEEVEASPSRADGVSAEMEDNLRRFGCDQIQRAVVLLDLPQVVAVTAQILLHRFYTRRSLKQFEVRSLSTAALWLAAKLEEVVEIDRPDHLRLRDVVMVCHRLSQRASGVLTPDLLDPNSMTYAEIKAAAVRDERHLLRALGFVIAVEQPHRFVLNYGALVLDASPQVQQEAWNLANDALRTTLCLTLRPEAIACGILFLAARRLGIPLPEDPPWWLPLGASTEEVHHVASTLCALYRKPAPEYVSLRDPPKRSPFAAASHSLHDAVSLTRDFSSGSNGGKSRFVWMFAMMTVLDSPADSPAHFI